MAVHLHTDRPPPCVTETNPHLRCGDLFDTCRRARGRVGESHTRRLGQRGEFGHRAGVNVDHTPRVQRDTRPTRIDRCRVGPLYGPGERLLVLQRVAPHVVPVGVDRCDSGPRVIPCRPQLHRRLGVVALQVLCEQGEAVSDVVHRLRQVISLRLRVPVQRPVGQLHGADTIGGAARP